MRPCRFDPTVTVVIGVAVGDERILAESFIGPDVHPDSGTHIRSHRRRVLHPAHDGLAARDRDARRLGDEGHRTRSE